MKRSTKICILRQGAPMLFYPAALPLSRQTLDYTAGIIRRQGWNGFCIVMYVTSAPRADVSMGA